MIRYSRLALLAALLSVPSTAALAADSDNPAEGVRALHDRLLVLDAHTDVLLPSVPTRDALPDGQSRVDLARLVEGGIDAIVRTVAVGPGPRDPNSVAAARREADQKLALIKTFAASDPARVGLALSATDVERLHAEGRIAVLISFQNARSIGSDLSQIDVFYRQGVRIFGFNHIGHNAFADSSRPWNEPPSEHGGLSPLGREAVAKLNDLGILIDVSQLSKDAVLQTVALSRAPVAATHSAARTLVDNVRNLSDAELDAIGTAGGVVQVPGFSAFLRAPDAKNADRVAALRARYGLEPQSLYGFDGVDTLPEPRRSALRQELMALIPKASVADFVDHIDYIARRIGWEHVGIGTDFDHGGGIAGFESEADAPNVTAELLKRGYSETQIRGIWGANFLRVLAAAEKDSRH